MLGPSRARPARPHNRSSAPAPPRLEGAAHLALEPHVQCVVQVQVPHQRRESRARRNSSLGLRPLLSVRHPNANKFPPLAHLAVRSPSPSSHPRPSASGIFANFRATYPRPTRSRTYASPDPLPTPAQGSLPARVGSPLAGRDLHPLDDEQGFMKSSHPSLLLDQPCLVAPDNWRTAESASSGLRRR